MKNKKGFTLIELLVVIAIIAILSTVVMAGLNQARSKARDSKRLTAVKEMQKALDLYYDTCGGYPILGSGAYVDIGTGGFDVSIHDGKCDDASGITFGTYMNPLPVNPTPGGKDFQYCSMPDGSDAVASSCSAVAGENTSYQITFKIDNDAAKMVAGDYVATPSGLKNVTLP